MLQSGECCSYIRVELERVWKEVVVGYLNHYPSTCLEGLWKTLKNSVTISVILVETGMLTAPPRHLIREQ